jgi:hypothetical protein
LSSSPAARSPGPKHLIPACRPLRRTRQARRRRPRAHPVRRPGSSAAISRQTSSLRGTPPRSLVLMSRGLRHPAKRVAPHPAGGVIRKYDFRRNPANNGLIHSQTQRASSPANPQKLRDRVRPLFLATPLVRPSSLPMQPRATNHPHHYVNDRLGAPPLVSLTAQQPSHPDNTQLGAICGAPRSGTAYRPGRQLGCQWRSRAMDEKTSDSSNLRNDASS